MNFGLVCKRSKPQSFVTSHQKEYKELTRAARSLAIFNEPSVRGECTKVERRQSKHVPKTEKLVLIAPHFFPDLVAFIGHKV